MNQPSFYAVVPAYVRYCKEIEMGAKLLYGELTALSSVEGFCWATNSYFSNLYDVDERTIQRWLNSLKKHKFIKIEIDRYEFKSQRKIWISHEIQKMFMVRQKCQPGVTKMSAGGDKNVIQINTMINTKNKREEDKPPTLDEIFKIHKRVKIKFDKFETLVKDYGSEKINEMMDRLDEYADINPKRFKNYACHAAVIRKWIREDKENVQKPLKNARSSSLASSSSVIENNRNLARSYESDFEKLKYNNHDKFTNVYIEAFSDRILFSSGQRRDEVLYSLDEQKFKEMCEHHLRKMRLIQ